MRLATSFIVGVWLEALVYGVYVVAFLVCLRLFRTHAPVVGRALPIWLAALFVLATAHCALSLSAVLDAFVRVSYVANHSPPAPSPSPSSVPGPGGPPQPNNGAFRFRDPRRYISNHALPTNLAALGVYAGVVLLSDLMMLYRLLVTFRYRFSWVVGPALLVVASFVISIVVLSKYAHIDSTLDPTTLQPELDAVSPWLPPTYVVAFFSNLAITTLMMFKTTLVPPKTRSDVPAFATRRRHARQTSLSAGDGFVFDIEERTGPVPGTLAPPARRRHMSSRWAVVAGFVESGALAPICMLAALILYVVQDQQEMVLPMLAPIAALVPTLQIIQLELGLDSTAHNRPVSHTPSTWTESERGPQGRSPYLVPAPRYRDSSSAEEDGSDAERMVDSGMRKVKSRRSNSRSNRDLASPTSARRFSAQLARGMWAWRGRASGSGSGSGSHARSRSQSGSSGREEPLVMLQMRDMAGSGGDTKARELGGDDGVWERIKLDDSKTPAPALESRLPPPIARRSTLRKSVVVQEMISKPIPIAPDFPPTTATIPSTNIIPTLPNFTINTEIGITAGNYNTLLRNTSAGATEHKYHYRVRPREKSASPLAAYLSAQALAQADERERQHQPAPLSSSAQHPPPPGYLGVGSASGDLASTTPTSPASGFTSLGPHSASKNPFRYDASSDSHGQAPYSDLRRAQPGPNAHAPLAERGTPAEAGTGGGIGLSGARRAPLTVPYSATAASAAPENPASRWTAPAPGAPLFAGLDTFFPSGRAPGQVPVQRDVSPAPGLQRDYARAREEVLRQMSRDKGGMTDDESVYSTQLLARR